MSKTIKVKNKDSDCGYMLINASDFKEGEHVLFEKEEAEAAAKKKVVKKRKKAKDEDN